MKNSEPLLKRNLSFRKTFFFKKTLQFCLVALFIVFAVIPAVVPKPSDAQTNKISAAEKRIERRARAQQRFAERLIKRASSQKMEDEERVELVELAMARCATPPVVGFACGGGGVVRSASDCGKCPKDDNPGSCSECCDDLAGSKSRRATCKANSCIVI